MTVLKIFINKIENLSWFLSSESTNLHTISFSVCFEFSQSERSFYVILSFKNDSFTSVNFISFAFVLLHRWSSTQCFKKFFFFFEQGEKNVWFSFLSRTFKAYFNVFPGWRNSYLNFCFRFLIIIICVWFLPRILAYLFSKQS